MLSLASPTDPSWAHRLQAHLEELLIDQAHCEKKAASTALSLMFRYVDQPRLQEVLSELAREELEHYLQTLAMLRSRGWAMRRQVPSPYASRLLQAVRTYEPARLVDTLLCCALIEARSCERMQVLSQHLADREVAHFFAELLASEARHYAVYVELARELGPYDGADLRQRLRELAEHEAKVLAQAPDEPRMHN